MGGGPALCPRTLRTESWRRDVPECPAARRADAEGRGWGLRLTEEAAATPRGCFLERGGGDRERSLSARWCSQERETGRWPGAEAQAELDQRLASSGELPGSQRILAMGFASVLSQNTLVLKLVSNSNLQRELMYIPLLKVVTTQRCIWSDCCANASVRSTCKRIKQVHFSLLHVSS